MFTSYVRTLTFILIVFISAFACAENQFVSVDGERFVDAEGRHLILHGFDNAGDFSEMREWGMNFGRVLMNWSRIEPECGVYDEEYLSALDKKVADAKANGIYVLLDMHQNLWGKGVPRGSGAPPWAMLTKDLPHIAEGPIWSMAYFQSERIQKSFDHFWANDPGPDGIGIQDRFAMMWQMLAKRYADEPNVIGFDIINEPFPGTPGKEAMKAMAFSMAKRLISQGVDIENMELFDIGMRAYEETCKEFALFKQWVDAGTEITRKAEKERLIPMYNRVAASIRKVNRHHIIFTAPFFMANLGIPSVLEPVTDAQGRRDPQYAFAPHAYQDDVQRMELLMDRLLATGKNMRAPILFGEWGNLTNNDKIFFADPIPAGRITLDRIQKNLCGSAYHMRIKTLPKEPYFEEILMRPYPAATAGILKSYVFDTKTKSFTCVWKENPAITAPTRVFIPACRFPNGFNVSLKPPSSNWTFEHASKQSPNGYLIIPPAGKPITRKLIVDAL